MKFVVDCMLGKLAKWLKVMGFDTVYSSRAEDDDLLMTAKKEKRVLLSRDNALLARAGEGKGLTIESDDWRDQLKQVFEALDLKGRAKPFSRCIECNRPLKTLAKSKARNLVSPHIFENARSFALCPQCGRVFWQGTHFLDMESRLEEILGKKNH